MDMQSKTNTLAAPSGPSTSSGQPSTAPSGNKKRTLVTDDEGFQTYTKKKRNNTSNNTVDNATNIAKTFSKFRIVASSSQEGYRQLSDFQKHNPNLLFVAKPNLKGEWIISPKNQIAFDKIRTSKHLNTTELVHSDKHFKAVVTSYPIALPLDPLLALPNINTAERMKNKFGILTHAILVTFIGTIPDRVELGVWGSFRTTTYNPEPLRCFKCQKFGHHRNQCTTNFKCAVCSGRHDTQICLDKHKQGGETKAKCPNCAGNHHAWFNRCPSRLDRIKQARPEIPRPNPAQTRAPLLPTPTNPWNKQPSSSSNAAPNTTNFYTPISTPNTRDFPPLSVTACKQQQQPRPLPQRPQPKPRRRQHKQIQSKQVVQTEKTTVTTQPDPIVSSTPEKQTLL